MRLAFAALILVAAASPLRAADSAWKQPPPEILQVLHAPDLPVTWPDPSGTTLALATRLRYPPIDELAAPMLRLAGVRVNPRNNGLHADSPFVKLSLLRIADGRTIDVALPAEARVLRLLWSHDGERFALTNRTPEAIELWSAAPRRASCDACPACA